MGGDVEGSMTIMMMMDGDDNYYDDG